MPLSPRDVFQIADRYCDSALLHHAHASGLFELLQTERTPHDVAATKHWIVDKAEIFLDALAALGLVMKQGTRYRNSPVANETLVRGRVGYIGDLIEHERLQWELWGRMDLVLRSRQAVPGQQDLHLPANEYANSVFHRAMMQLAGELLSTVAKLPQWRTTHHVLDLAGGHGLYLAEVARLHPHITGEIWDVASARDAAESVIAARGVGDRIRFVERDVLSAASFSGVRADAVMLNHCLHHFNLRGVGTIARSVAGVLPPGGVAIVLDVHLEPDRISPPESAMFSLYMMVNTVQGQVHSTSSIEKAFRSIGFVVQTQVLDSLEGDFLMIAVKQ